MSDFFADPTYPVARKPHQCIYCYAMIPKGEGHTVQTGFYDGAPFRNRFHNECWADFGASGEDEFCPGEAPPPDRLLETAA